MMIDLSEVRALLANRLGARGYAHSVAVADTAARLADEYGVDREEAYLAGLLHDWARDDDGSTLRSEAERLGIESTPADEARPYLLHARTGAAGVQERFPDLPDRIIAAIERHTFGAVEMSDLDRVVYLADELEPGRGTRAAAELRHEVGRIELAELYERAYAASLERLVRRRRRIHPATIEAWNAIIEERH